nr:lysophospholipid acyltransferase family protein [uncultured Oscillibacter sp.]
MKPFNRLFVVVYYVVGLITRILHPVSVEGMEKLPKSGVLLCPNHSSNWDPILVALRLPINYRLHIMAKEELFQNPLLGWLLRKVGAFPVSRGNNDINAVKQSIQALKDGDNLLIFPEGTTVRNGIGYLDGLPPQAKAGVAMIGVRTGATLIPVFVDGEKKLFHRTRIIFGDPYVPQYTGRRGTSEEMQKIADDLLEASYALGGQAVGGKPRCG